MIERFNDSNKIIIYKDYMNDTRVNSVSTPEGDEQCKGLTNTNLKNYTYNMYASDESTDVNKLLKGSDISVATPRSITIQCSMPSVVANAKYTHARVSGANLNITWPNGQNTIQPIPAIWVRGFKGIGFSQTLFDFLTPSLCDGCKVSITSKSSNTGNIGLNVIRVSLATDANGTDSIIADSSYIRQPQLITSDISKIVLFTANNNEGGDIIVTTKRNITVELRCSSTYYYSVEITSMPTYSAIGSSITGNILFEPSYSNIQINQLLSTYTFSVDDGDYNIVFSVLKATVRRSFESSAAQTVAVRPSPGNITITEGDTTTYKVVYDLGMPDINT